MFEATNKYSADDIAKLSDEFVKIFENLHGLECVFASRNDFNGLKKEFDKNILFEKYTQDKGFSSEQEKVIKNMIDKNMDSVLDILDFTFSVSENFAVCGQSCGQMQLWGTFGWVVKSHNRPCSKGFRRFGFARLGYRHGTPKPRALPAALHPGSCCSLCFSALFRSACAAAGTPGSSGIIHHLRGARKRFLD